MRFDRAGVKTLSTAVAHLAPAPAVRFGLEHAEPQAAAALNGSLRAGGAAAPATSGSGASSGGGEDGGWLRNLETPSPRDALVRLPENCTDPFSSPSARLNAVLLLYRFSEQGGSLLDWAASQLNIKDPLSIMNRHELEQVFQRFKVVRDDQLKKQVLEFRKKDPNALAAILKGATASVQQALKRFDIGR